ncbi:Abi-alpha family protein [Desulfuromonas versatilis]|nr:Abi-alpha family protein [Desulfuromonas versatilis]
MTEEGLDIDGVGKLAKAIPQKAWVQIVDTACTTFKDCISPITSTASGLGRLIDAKFERLVESEKIIVSQHFKKANEKVKNTKKTVENKPKINILINVIECSSYETDEIIKELWANLIAQEIIGGSVHPDFINILKRMDAKDAKRLAKIAEESSDKSIKEQATLFIKSIKLAVAGIEFSIPDEPTDFTAEHLSNLNLIQKTSGKWVLTNTGRAFIEAASDPEVIIGK